MEQIRRIMEMENILTRALEALQDPSCASDRLCALQPELERLEAYYTGPLWKKDFDDDCAGRLPKGLRRGVLSEDAVYDLLSAVSQLRQPDSKPEPYPENWDRQP